MVVVKAAVTAPTMTPAVVSIDAIVAALAVVAWTVLLLSHLLALLLL